MNLADNKEQDGGFQIVPGFHHHLERWAKSPKGMALVKRYGWRETFIMLPDDIEFHEHSIRVTARAGSVVFWDQRTMHGSRPNESPNPRYAQFFKIFPATMYSKRATARQAAIKEMIRLHAPDLFKHSLFKIGRAVQQECRDRSRMPSSA
eukprot:TRINITY_DN10928_c0_g1_i3.p1 TRINITY_DN10928_c0_g1~~TRINITY_DN10928_c0_g1_i3.p1  ORF type:complete len:150 (+),score=15.27 TRINITY_DN10928_c0_g1_i3:166-615(+)